MLFMDNEHEVFFWKKAKELDILGDVERMSLVYLLSLTRNCRENFKTCYNAEKRCICSNVLEEDWLTSDDCKLIRLAFNLFNWGAPTTKGMSDRESLREAYEYYPTQIFSSYFAPYFWQAIQIRFPEYCAL